jgi:leucyl-tRNA synthetase
MGVPAHDERDFEFAQEFDLPVKIVIAPPDYNTGADLEEAFMGEGKMVNSGSFNGLLNVAASEQITDYLETHKLGKRKIQYRMRDWLISRQRYWGTPIPIVSAGSDIGEHRSPLYIVITVVKCLSAKNSCRCSYHQWLIISQMAVVAQP